MSRMRPVGTNTRLDGKRSHATVLKEGSAFFTISGRDTTGFPANHRWSQGKPWQRYSRFFFLRLSQQNCLGKHKVRGFVAWFRC
jgi:hypothetical protein